MDPIIQISVSYALALLWLVGAAMKLTNFKAFRATVRDYRVLPGVLALPAAAMVTGFEIGLGVALLASMGRSTGLVLSAILLTVYAAAISVNLVRGRRHIDCGCMGPGLRQPLSAWLVGRNLALAAAALAGTLAVESRALFWVDGVSIVATVGILVALYAALNRLIANERELTSLGS